MKKKYIPQKLLQLSVIFSTAIHQMALPLSAANSVATESAKPIDTQPQKGLPASNGLPIDLTVSKLEPDEDAQKTILINFNNISIIEYIRFISRIINKNFVFDENDLQFNVTIISEEPATLDNIMTALLQELRIHDLSLLEQGNNLIIHRNPKVNAISQLVNEDISRVSPTSDIITQVFRLNTANPQQVAAVIRPLTSEYALVEVLDGTNHLIITDLSTNVVQIAKLIKSVDSPVSGLVIGQYVARTTAPAVLIDMARQILSPIAQDQTLTMVPWDSSNSIFIVSAPFIVERALSILQHIDLNEKSTKIFDLQDLRYKEVFGHDLPPAGLYLNNAPFLPDPVELEETIRKMRMESEKTSHPSLFPLHKSLIPGRWIQTDEGIWRLPLGHEPSSSKETPPQGNWKIDDKDQWYFQKFSEKELDLEKVYPSGLTRGQLETFSLPQDQGQPLSPFGKWLYDPSAGWTYELEKGETTGLKKLERHTQKNIEIPLGQKEKKYFSIYKLQFRKGESIQYSLRSIADGLRAGGPDNSDLVDTLMTVQWLPTSNSLIFTGHKENLLKMRDLMGEIDTPLRQVFIEMLILETSMADSLEYGVTWGTRFSGNSWAGGQGFSIPTSPINTALNLADTNGALGAPVANLLGTGTGLSLGVIGQKIINTALGVEFSSIGGLLHALRSKANQNVILSPKIITEDGVPAEIFVGENVSFKTQSLANDNSNTITNNYEYRDVGTRMRVTPLIGNNDVIYLEIAQEISAIIPSTVPTDANAPGPSTTKSTTTTRVHLPDGYFLIISGMIRDEAQRFSTQVPCLGSIPVLGAAFKDKIYNDTKRNQMIFLRPKIVDTEEDVQNLTEREQNIWNYKARRKQDWVLETEDAFDFLNLKRDVVEADPVLADKDV